MSMTKVLIRNAASNGIGYCVNAVVTFFLTPYILSSLGQTRYGIWILASSLTGYYGLLDLGFRGGITQYLTRYVATKDTARMNETISTGFLTLMCCGIFVLLGSVVVSMKASSFFHIPSSIQTEARSVIIIMGISVASQFAFFANSAVFTAVQRYDISNMIGIATRLLSAISIACSLHWGYGLVGVSLAIATTNILDYIVRWRVSLHLLPTLHISLALASKQSFFEFMKFGLWNVLITGSARLISYTDALVIAAFLPIAAVSAFSIAAGLRDQFEAIFIPIATVFFPATTTLDAEGNKIGLQSLYLTCSKLMLLGSLLIGLVVAKLSASFFSLWIGSTNAYPVGLPPISKIFIFLVCASILSVSQRVGYQVLLGTRKLAVFSLLLIVEGFVNLALSIILVRSCGLIGVAIGTLLPALIFHGILHPLVICRFLQIPTNVYLRNVIYRPLCAGIPCMIILTLLFSYITITSWMSLINASIACCIIIFPFAWLIGLNSVERGYINSLPLVTRCIHFLRHRLT